jgi:hypothetical protein
VAGLFLDPTGHHTLAVLRNARSAACETHYMHRWAGRGQGLGRVRGREGCAKARSTGGGLGWLELGAAR